MAESSQSKPDPGVAPFGNFINYYQFNSAEARLQLLPTPMSQLNNELLDDKSTQTAATNTAAVELPPNFWSQATANYADTEPYIVLDVGCNAGNFTQLLYGDFLRKHCGGDAANTNRNVHILGIDIDATLIERARELNQHPANVTYACADMMGADAAAIIERYLDGIVPGRRTFNAVFCMSLTMWIHLNHGDAGLARFLGAVSSLAALLVIEPQPWKCYSTAVRRQRRAASGRPFPMFYGLRWRQDVEEQIDGCLVRECGRRRVFRTVPTAWDRRIALYMLA